MTIMTTGCDLLASIDGVQFKMLDIMELTELRH